MKVAQKFLIFFLTGLIFQIGLDLGAKEKRNLSSIDKLKKDLPIIMCLPGSYLERCYSFENGECPSKITQLTQLCANKANPQAAFNPMTGGEIGACVGNEFKKLRKEKKKGEHCLAGAILF